MDDIVSAYMDYCWREKNGAPLSQTSGPDMFLEIVDIFGVSSKAIPRSTDRYQSASLVRSGIIPVAPLIHTFGFTIRTVDLYHKLFVRCARLGMQSFCKSICDIHGVAYKPYLSTQLSAAFDLYIAILNTVRNRTREFLGRQGRDWRMLNTCPPCQYRLQEDDKLDVRMIVTMDGNDSLRRVEQKEDTLQSVEENGETLPQTSRERMDHRVGGGDYFASRSETNAWAEANWPNADDLPVTDSPAVHVWEEGRCEDRWENMKDTNTVRSSAKFFEHGWFVVLCRHMALLLACDMVKSGEL
ncbi:MAG: hypothetical protein NXY57DRAFT_970657 [Lentinula lateritia]|nr:MAG: hypothetical protein NXY57DRAFT_970657 [Lentinula lateritia]